MSRSKNSRRGSGRCSQRHCFGCTKQPPKIKTKQAMRFLADSPFESWTVPELLEYVRTLRPPTEAEKQSQRESWVIGQMALTWEVSPEEAEQRIRAFPNNPFRRNEDGRG